MEVQSTFQFELHQMEAAPKREYDSFTRCYKQALPYYTPIHQRDCDGKTYTTDEDILRIDLRKNGTELVTYGASGRLKLWNIKTNKA